MYKTFSWLLFYPYTYTAHLGCIIEGFSTRVQPKAPPALFLAISTTSHLVRSEKVAEIFTSRPYDQKHKRQRYATKRPRNNYPQIISVTRENFYTCIVWCLVNRVSQNFGESSLTKLISNEIISTPKKG